jgi:hypothetical protein
MMHGQQSVKHVESSGNAAHFNDLEVDGRIILKFMSEKLFWKMGN